MGEVERRVEKMWDLSGAFPIPKFLVTCPSCQTAEVTLQQVGFTQRDWTGSPAPWRCNIGFKCCECSMVWLYGVPVSKEMFDKGFLMGQMGWRQAEAYFGGS
jgi:hypothetical protein